MGTTICDVSDSIISYCLEFLNRTGGNSYPSGTLTGCHCITTNKASPCYHPTEHYDTWDKEWRLSTLMDGKN